MTEGQGTLSLSDLWNTTISGVGEGVARGVSGLISPVRSQNAAPTPDITAQAATPGGNFLNAKAYGVPAVILLIGGAALVYLIARR